MFLLWHSEIKPPIVVESKEELVVYIKMQEAVGGGGTPRYKDMPEEYFEGMYICCLCLEFTLTWQTELPFLELFWFPAYILKYCICR